MNAHCKKLILGIGNPLRSDDAAGSIVARKLTRKGLVSIDAEFMPENYVGIIRRHNPEKIIIVDTCDMALTPGEVRIIPLHKIHTGIVTTHSVPLVAIIKKLQEITTDIVYIGIQPENIELGDTVTKAVKKSIEQVVAMIDQDNENKIPML